MIHLGGNRFRLCDGFTRRDVLTIGALGAAGVSLADVLRAEEKTGRREMSCIFFFLHGGMSQLDTFDMRPDAPAHIRGEFRPVPTKVPGYHICEHLPRLARMTDRFSVIRSMTHKFTNHQPGSIYTLGGKPPLLDVSGIPISADDHPNPGAVISRLRGNKTPMPTFVQLSAPLVGDNALNCPGQNAGILGPSYDPLKITDDPDRPGFNVEELSLPKEVGQERLRRRRNLLAAVDEGFPLIGQAADVSAMDKYYKRAFEMLTSPAARKAFDIGQEPEAVRERYGRNVYAQRLLLARRLVEAGVRMVTVYWGGNLNSPDDYWDTHRRNFGKQKELLLPQWDQCFSALLEDLESRGLLDTTLVVCAGEFGRTPKVGQITANAGTDATGRDHWPFCYSVVLAGGGVKGGRQIGRGDATTAAVTDRPVRPEDVTATLYDRFGLAPETEIHDLVGRPHPISRGAPVTELF